MNEEMNLGIEESKAGAMESRSIPAYLEEKRETAIRQEAAEDRPETEAEELARIIQSYRDSGEKVYSVTTTVSECDDDETEYTFLFKKPRPASYDRYVKAVSNSATKATKMFAQDNIVPEQLEYLKEIFEEYPAMSIDVAGKLLNMLGLSSNTIVKKL